MVSDDAGILVMVTYNGNEDMRQMRGQMTTKQTHKSFQNWVYIALNVKRRRTLIPTMNRTRVPTLNLSSK